jgi:acyl-CoA synthetase (AMP-forming)/AMP-acid ligase II
MHQILLLHPPKEIPNIRFIRSCSASLAPPTFHALEETFKAPVLEAYAMTEAAHQMTSNPLPPAARKPGSVGLGQGVEIAILDNSGKHVAEGEVCIKGANVTKGYLNNPQANQGAFTADGWFRTGDQGKKDKDGYLILTGRIKELINRGGEKISPLEIDGVLLAFPKAAEAICFGVADEMYGQEVHAAVVLKKANENEDPKKIEKEMQEFASAKLAKFKIPKRIYVVKEMQKTATGKVSRVKMSEAANKQKDTPKAKL